MTQNSASTTPPTITINGNNSTTINVGDNYADLGANVTDNVDQNLGLKYFLNGALVSNITIDTSAAATDTIDYVAADNAATSTRTIIIEPAPSIVPTPDGSTTTAASSPDLASTTSATSGEEERARGEPDGE